MACKRRWTPTGRPPNSAGSEPPACGRALGPVFPLQTLFRTDKYAYVNMYIHIYIHVFCIYIYMCLFCILVCYSRKLYIRLYHVLYCSILCYIISDYVRLCVYIYMNMFYNCVSMDTYTYMYISRYIRKDVCIYIHAFILTYYTYIRIT